MRKIPALTLTLLFALCLFCGCIEENAVSNESGVNESLNESYENITSDVSEKEISDEEESSNDENSSYTEDTASDEDTTSVDEETAAFEALISQLEFPEYDVPENVIYNTPSIIKKERYMTSMYPSTTTGLRYETGDKKSNLEKLVEKNLGNDDVWFYVAIRSNDVNTTKTLPIPTKRDLLIDHIEGSKRLLDIGFIPDYDHFWSYSHVVKAYPRKVILWQHPIVGYMTADMINELTDINKVEGYTYRILHLTEDKYFDEYFKNYDFNEIIIYDC